MGMIKGIVLPEDIDTQLGGAGQDAAKAFMKAASQGMAAVLADALVDSLGSVVGGTGPAPDWTTFIRGCVCHLEWETPAGTTVERAIAFSQNSSGGGSLGGVSVSVSISACF